MRHRKTYMYANFQQNRAHTIICKKIDGCINLQLPIVILNKSIVSDMRHRKTYCSESFLNVLLMLNVIYLRHTVLIYIVHQCGLTALRQLLKN